jgi:hypothetical protein
VTGDARCTRHIHERHTLKGHLGKKRLAKRTTGDRPSGSLNGVTRIVHGAFVTKPFLHLSDITFAVQIQRHIVTLDLKICQIKELSGKSNLYTDKTWVYRSF